jgi:hypothetical protein
VEIQAQGEGDAASLEIRAPDGSLRIGSGGGRPDWLPEYPGAVSVGSLEGSSSSGSAAALTYKTQDSAEDVISFYEEALRNSGFEIQKPGSESAGQTGMIMLVATQAGSKRTAHITAVGSPEGTMITLAFQNPQ